MSGSQSSARWGRRPTQSITTRLGVPRSSCRPMVFGGLEETGAMASWCSNTQCSPSKVKASPKTCWIRMAWKSVGDTNRTEHLERLDYHHLASQVGQSQISGGVDPAGNGQFGSERVFRSGPHRQWASTRTPWCGESVIQVGNDP